MTDRSSEIMDELSVEPDDRTQSISNKQIALMS